MYVDGKNKCGNGNDSVKLLALYSERGDRKVPEPASALLLGVAALAGVARS